MWILILTLITPGGHAASISSTSFYYHKSCVGAGKAWLDQLKNGWWEKSAICVYNPVVGNAKNLDDTDRKMLGS